MLVMLLLGTLVLQEVFLWRGRKSNLMTVTMILLAGLIVLNANNEADFSNYESVYEHIALTGHYDALGVGWVLLNRLGLMIGLTFRQLKTVIYVISLIILCVGFYNMSKGHGRIALALSLYMVYSSLLDMVQFRFFLAEAICFLAYSLLDSTWKRRVLYVILCLCAYTIHSSVIIYLALLLADAISGWDSRRIHKLQLLAVIVSALVVLFGRTLIYQIAPFAIGLARTEYYLVSGSAVGPFGLLAYPVVLAMSGYIIQRMFAETQSSELDERSLLVSCNTGKQLMETLKRASGAASLMWMLLPLTFFDTNIFRLQRMEWLILYTCLIVYLKLAPRPGYLRIFGVRVTAKVACLVMSVFGLVFFTVIFNPNIVRSFILSGGS